MAIRIVRNTNGNCITFVGSSRPAYWNACLSGQVNDDDGNRIDIINDIRTTDSDNPVYEFYAVPYTEFQDTDGNSFASATECAAYITAEANVVGGITRLDAQDLVDFARDDTNTSILTSLGDSFGVNAIDATAESDGTITIEEYVSSGTQLYQGLRHTNVTIEGQAPTSSMTLTSVVNALNSLFRVTPVGAGADDPLISHTYSDTTPTVTAFGDVTITTGTATKGTNTGSQLNDGFFTSGTSGIHHVNAAGEYFELNNTGENFGRKFIIGLLEVSKFVDAATTLESITTSGAVVDLGVRFAPNAAYENSDYGVVIENGFFQGPSASNQFRAGVRDDSRLFISHYNETDEEWQDIVRSAFPVDIDNEEYMLVCFINNETSTFDTSSIVCKQITSGFSFSYRYIESPDGSFHYPLFANQDEANTLDDINGGSGTSTGNIYVDEPTNTTWYMPDTGSTTGGSSAPTNTESVTYTEISTLADNLFAPAALTLPDYTFTESQSVNIQIIPAGLTATVAVTGLPAPLTYNAGFITGTTRYVTGDTTYTITVEQSNSYGSTTQTFDITITDNTSLNTITGWTALKSDQIAFQPDNIPHYSPEAAFDFNLTLDQGSEFTWTQTNGAVLGNGGPGLYMQFGIVTSGVDKATATLGDNTSNWDLKGIPWTSAINFANRGPTGWVNNNYVPTGSNDGVTWKLSYEQDGADYKIVLYRNGVEVARSADAYTGNQTITVAYPEAYTANSRLPAISKTLIGAGSTTPPTGFEDPLLVGEMASLTLMGDHNGEDAAAELTDTLGINYRYIFPQTWIEANVLPHMTESGDEVHFGVPESGVSWTDVGMDDWDASIFLGGLGTATHVSALITEGVSADAVVVNSETDAYYDYALEWDGTDLHIIACNVNDINTQPGVSNGGTFSRTTSVLNYTGQTGALPLAIGVDGGAQVNLTTTGLQSIRIPFGARDILVGENSNGSGDFSGLQPATSKYDEAPSGHTPSDFTFDAPTVNAGYTYRFIYHPSMESGDYIEFRLASDNTTVYTTGVTTFGSGDPDFTGAYKGVEFAVPSNAPPLRIYFYNSFSGQFDTGRDLTISGSTYSVGVTGATQEGPVANQTGDNLFDVGDHGWLSIDDQLGAGQRLVMNTAFLADLVDAMPDNTYIKIGLKDTNWITSTTDLNFEGAVRFVITRNSSSSVDFRTTSGDGGVNRTTNINTSVAGITSNNMAAFLDITSSGNNIRFGIRSDSINNTDSASTTAYADWDSSYKVQTGAQSYGITSVDVMILGKDESGGTNTVGMNATDVDWTGLSEISVPTPAATLTTNWTKALDFSGSSERTQQVTALAAIQPLRMNDSGSTVAAPTAGNTTSAGHPWATAIVFSSDNHSSNQHIWNQGEGSGSTNDNIYLRVSANRELYFGWGRSGALNECFLGTLSSGANNWYGIYVAHTGERLSGANATAANLADCFDIRDINLQTGVVGSQISTSSNWTAGSTGGRMDRTVTGNFTVGGRGSNRSFHGKVASMVVTTLRNNVAMPTDAEISMMVRDPQQWVTDYKVNQSFRRPHQTGDTTPFSLSESSSWATQVWLMGDGTGDAYAQIRNQIWNPTQNYTPLNMISMVSNDIQTVSINGLT